MSIQLLCFNLAWFLAIDFIFTYCSYNIYFFFTHICILMLSTCNLFRFFVIIPGSSSCYRFDCSQSLRRFLVNMLKVFSLLFFYVYMCIISCFFPNLYFLYYNVIHSDRISPNVFGNFQFRYCTLLYIRLFSYESLLFSNSKWKRYIIT